MQSIINRKFILRFASFLLVCVTTLMLFTYYSVDSNVSASSTDTKKQIQTLESSLSKIEQQKKQLNNSLNSAKADKNNQIAIKKNLDSEVSLLTEEISTTEDLIAQYEIQTQNTDKEISQLEEDCNKKKDELDEMLRMSFEYGTDSYLEIIFGAESFSDFLSRIDLISYRMNYNDNVLKDLYKKQQELDAARQKLESSKASLAEYKKSKEGLKVSLNQKIVQADNAISDLTKDQAALEKALKEADAAKVKLQNDIEDLAKSLNDNSQYTGGVFMWPLPSSCTSISASFGNRANPFSPKKTEFHNGIDLPAPSGTKIFAASAGTVVKAEWYSGFGNCVIINHGGGIMTLYGHCKALNVKVGAVVKKGDVIAFVGTTGLSTGNHLHFTVYESGSTAVNPLKYLK